jgi:tetratricopeptide (TPR) repeat protein
MSLSGLRSVLCAPIVHKSRGIIGVLYADDKRTVGAFGQEHLDWLVQIGKALGSRAVFTPLEKDEPVTRTSPVEDWKNSRNQALVALKAGDLDSAETCLKRALGCFEPECFDTLSMARTLSDLSEVYRLQSRFNEAEHLISEALRIADSDANIGFQQTIPFLNNLAGLYYAKGEAERAKSVYAHILSELDRHGDRSQARAVPVICNLGTLCLREGQVIRALGYFAEATRLAEEAWGESNPVTTRCRLKLAECQKLSA